MSKLDGIKPGDRGRVTYPYNPRYIVGSEGRVWGPHGEMKPSRRHSGKPYLAVTLNSPRKTAHVHKMVAETFLGPCPDGHQVAHLNGDATDNRVENLKYVSCQENILQKRDHGTMCRGDCHVRSVLTEADVRFIRSSDKSASDLGRQYGVTETAVRLARSGKTWSHIQ